MAFALREVIASAAGWLAVAFGGFRKVGDGVQRGGIRGDVIDIGAFRTTLMECGQWVDADLQDDLHLGGCRRSAPELHALVRDLRAEGHRVLRPDDTLFGGRGHAL